MEDARRRTDKYNQLILDLEDMLDKKSRGYTMAQSMNDQMWEELGTHKERMLEQIQKINNSMNDRELLDRELSSAETIYEATRNYISKHKTHI